MGEERSVGEGRNVRKETHVGEERSAGEGRGVCAGEKCG